MEKFINILFLQIIMTESYEPSRKEIFGEIFRPMKNYVSKNNIKRLGQEIIDGGKMFLLGTASLAVLPYALPSSVKVLIECEAERKSFKVKVKDVRSSISAYSEDMGVVSGLVAGVTLNIGQVMAYNYLVKNNHPEVLLIPLATNAVSGIYEGGRYLYRKAKNRLIKKHRESLESAVSSSQE